MIGQITPLDKTCSWSEPFASRETTAVEITNNDGSVFDSTKTWVLAISDGATPLATSDDDNATALTLSSNRKTLSGSIYLNTTELVTDRMDVSLQDFETWQIELVSTDAAATLITDAVDVLKTAYFFGAEDPTGLTGGAFNDLAAIAAIADADTFAIYDLSATTYLKSTFSTLWTWILAKLAALLSAKGDILVRGASSVTRLAVGADGTQLTAASGEAAGVKWDTASVTNHALLSNLNWAAAGHTIDADIVPTTDSARSLGDNTTPLRMLGVYTDLLDLPATADAATGVLSIAGTRMLHSYGTRNLFLGDTAGNLTLTGADNIMIGRTSGAALTGGNNNLGIGNDALNAIEGGLLNTAVGHNAMGVATATSRECVAVGIDAAKNSSGNFLTAVGFQAGEFLGVAGGVAVGYKAGRYAAGNAPVCIGREAGEGVSGQSSGDGNVFVGLRAGTAFTTGDHNICLGQDAGAGITTGSRNVILGFEGALSQVTTQDDQLYIANSNTATPLIGGDFSTPIVTINGALTATGAITLSILSSNGFVKTSGGTGALSIDTTTYGTAAAVALNTTHRGSAGTDHSDVGLNNTHRTSDGSDHAFLDQSLVNGSAPVLVGTNFSSIPVGALPSGSWGAHLIPAADSTWTLGERVTPKRWAEVHTDLLAMDATDSITHDGLNYIIGDSGLATTGEGEFDLGTSLLRWGRYWGTSANYNDGTNTAAVNYAVAGFTSTWGDYTAVLAQDFMANQRAGWLSDTVRTVTLCDGTNALDITGNTISNGTFTWSGGGSANANTAFAHVSSNGTDHANVALNDTHRTSNGTDHANVALNDTHRGSAGTDHSDVGLNNTHRGSAGTDHSDVVANTAASHAESHTIVSHSDTTATGANLNTLVGGGETALHSHAAAGFSAYTELFAAITPGADAAWTAVDVSGSAAVGDVLEIVQTNIAAGNEREAGVRAFGSGLARLFDLHEAEQGGVTPLTQHVTVLDNAGTATIEVYEEADADVVTTIVGKLT